MFQRAKEKHMGTIKKKLWLSRKCYDGLKFLEGGI